MGTIYKYINVSIALLGLISFAGCVRKEIGVQPHVPGDYITASVNMGQDYTWQYYYSLKNNEVVAKNTREEWSLGFEASADGYHIILNPARTMSVYESGKTDFNAVKLTDTIGKVNKLDAANGCLDSTAIGEWKGKNTVYIINEGYNNTFGFDGFSKVQLLSVDESGYKIRCAKINGTSEATMTIPKDSAYNFVFLRLGTTPKIVSSEPPKDSWDIVFTRYTHIFYDLNQPYAVVGCLLNRYNTSAVVDSITGYDEITYEKAQGYTLSNYINTIGYDWKLLGSTTGGGSDYQVLYKKNYIIKASDGAYYKLRFIDFYNEQKEKGCPKWEYQKL